jgi:sialate O-acetylesterase
MKSTVLLFLVLLSAARLLAELRVASPFGDHMVLQQGQPIPVWGTATPGDQVTVVFAGQKESAVADSTGKWRVDLKELKASAEPRELTVTSGNRESKTENQKFTDVLVGEVWLCGGQSNMERQLGLRSGQPPIVNWEAEAAAASHPLIRQLYVQQSRAVTPQSTVAATWSVCSPETVADFTAVGYFFARDLHAKLGVPVGIIHSSWGGTPSEAWTSREGLKNFPEFNEAIDSLQHAAANAAEAQRLYAGKIARWFAANDPGSGAAPWHAPGLDTAGWETMNLPAMWEEAGHEGFDGIAWFRRSFDLPADWAGRDLVLRLGAIDDVDTTWVNGVEVGTTSGWTASRAYRVPASALRAKDNVIAVRVLDTGGGGGIWDPQRPPSLTPAEGPGAPLPLKGPWRSRFAVELARFSTQPPADTSQNAGTPTGLFNGMIAPLVPYALRGVTFYQGEANAGRALQYRTLFPAMIADWRRLWGQGEFPFLFVQIAPFKDQPPEIREAQLIAWKNTKNTAMAVTIDVGDAKDIHPANKGPVGARLALAARAVAYGEKIEYSGPVYEKLTVQGGRAVLAFTHLGGGLTAPGGTLTGFTVAGADGVFHPAKAEIAGDTVVVSSPNVATPVAVRYGWANVASGNLFNKAGLPASPFRTDAPVP